MHPSPQSPFPQKNTISYSKNKEHIIIHNGTPTENQPGAISSGLLFCFAHLITYPFGPTESFGCLHSDANGIVACLAKVENMDILKTHLVSTLLLGIS